MAIPEELKADVALVDVGRRVLLRKLLGVVRDAELDTFLPFASGVDTKVAELPDDEAIPNSTNYAGAKPMVRDRWLKVGTLLRQALGLLEKAKAEDPTLLSDAIGINAD